MGFQTLVLPKTKHTNKNWDKKTRNRISFTSKRRPDNPKSNVMRFKKSLVYFVPCAWNAVAPNVCSVVPFTNRHCLIHTEITNPSTKWVEASMKQMPWDSWYARHSLGEMPVGSWRRRSNTLDYYGRERKESWIESILDCFGKADVASWSQCLHWRSHASHSSGPSLPSQLGSVIR